MKKLRFDSGIYNSPLFLLIFVQIFLSIAIWFDIFVVRQILGFFYLTFVPGYLILVLVKIDEKLDSVGKITFSAGLSLSLLMLIGLFENEFAPLLGVSKSLSLLPLFICLNGTFLVIAILSHLTHGKNSASVGFFTGIPKSTAIFLIPLILSISGTFLVNAYNVNSALMAMIVVMGVLFAVAIFSKRICPSKIYPFIILAFALALVLHTSLISNYVNGPDIQVEHYVFKATLQDLRWSSTSKYWWDETYGRFNSMLSVTILPTMYSVFLNLSTEWVLKIVFPAIFALVPVALYRLWTFYLDRRKALVATFILMSQLTFYLEMPSLTREMVAELLVVLLFTVLLTKNFDSLRKNLCFLVLGTGLVVSHYSIAYIFLFFMFSAWLLLFIRKKVSTDITLPKIATFFVIAFAWYIYTSTSASYMSLLSFGNSVFSDLSRFFDISSRGSGVMAGLGLGEVPSFWNYISRVVAYTLQVFIAIGYLAIVLRKTPIKFSKEYTAFSLVSGVVLGLCIVLPRFAGTLNIERFYHILLFFLSPLCVVGAMTIVTYVSFLLKGRHLHKHSTDFLTVVLLGLIVIPYLFFQTSLVYEVVGSEDWSLPLSKNRMEPKVLYVDLAYIEGSDVFGARWLSQHFNVNEQTVYSDKITAYNVLTSYGMLYRGQIHVISNTQTFSPFDFIYLSRMNLNSKVILTFENYYNSTSDFAFLFNNTNVVFSNGECEIVQFSK